MKANTAIALAFGGALVAGAVAPHSAQAQSPAPTKTNSTYGKAVTISQTDYAVTGTYNATLVTTAGKTDDLERLYNPGGATTGPATITIDAASPVKTVDSGNGLRGLVDASQGNGAGGFTIFSGTGSDGSVPTGTAAAIATQKVLNETIVDFTFNDPAAPFGDTLTGLGLTTLATGDGRGYYDVDFAYSTDGVTFTKILTAQDSGFALTGASGTGGIDEFLQATGMSIANVKVLQMIERPNITSPTNPYYIQGSAIAEVDAFFTPSPAATPEPSQTAAMGLGALGLAGLALAARKRRASAL